MFLLSRDGADERCEDNSSGGEEKGGGEDAHLAGETEALVRGNLSGGGLMEERAADRFPVSLLGRHQKRGTCHERALLRGETAVSISSPSQLLQTAR